MELRPHPLLITRPVTCARCGTSFDCTPGACWCTDVPVRLPMPSADSDEDCLCPTCLRAAASAGPGTD